MIVRIQYIICIWVSTAVYSVSLIFPTSYRDLTFINILLELVPRLLFCILNEATDNYDALAAVRHRIAGAVNRVPNNRVIVIGDWQIESEKY